MCVATKYATRCDDVLPIEIWDLIVSFLCTHCPYIPPDEESRALRATCHAFQSLIDERSSIVVYAPIDCFTRRMKLERYDECSITAEVYANMHVSAYVRTSFVDWDEIVKDIEWLEYVFFCRVSKQYASIVRRMFAPMYKKYQK